MRRACGCGVVRNAATGWVGRGEGHAGARRPRPGEYVLLDRVPTPGTGPADSMACDLRLPGPLHLPVACPRPWRRTVIRLWTEEDRQLRPDLRRQLKAHLAEQNWQVIAERQRASLTWRNRRLLAERW